jgi:hypothetical protein
MPAHMPAVTIITIICAFIAVVVFVSGYVKGFKASVVDFDSAAESSKEDISRGWGYLIPLAVIAAGIVIALLGVSPIFISLAPFLSIASAATIGLLFYIEPHLD